MKKVNSFLVVFLMGTMSANASWCTDLVNNPIDKMNDGNKAYNRALENMDDERFSSAVKNFRKAKLYYEEAEILWENAERRGLCIDEVDFDYDDLERMRGYTQEHKEDIKCPLSVAQMQGAFAKLADRSSGLSDDQRQSLFNDLNVYLKRAENSCEDKYQGTINDIRYRRVFL